jgi:DinB superfamily
VTTDAREQRRAMTIAEVLAVLIERSDYRDLEFAESFRAFARQRASLLAFLKALPRRSWSRTAVVTGGGPARERTVLFYGAWLARHERAHVDRLARDIPRAF